MKDIAAELVNRGADMDHADKFMKGVAVKRAPEQREAIVLNGLRILHDRGERLLSYFRKNDHQATAAYLESLFGTYLTPLGEASRPPFIHQIFLHWANHDPATDTYMKKGVYQIFRRFKPRLEHGPDKDGFCDDPEDAVIIELLYLDPEAKECVIISSEFNVYWGTAHLNEDRMLAMILQRPMDGNDAEIRHRFVAIHAKHPQNHKPNIYSSLYMKSGDLTRRPLSGEAILNYLPREHHEAAYERLESIFSSPYRFLNVQHDAAIEPYIATFHSRGASEGTAQARLDDVPYIKLLTLDEDGIVLLREPLRSTDAEALERLSTTTGTKLEPYKRTGDETPPPEDG